MNRTGKAAIVETLSEQVSGAQLIVLTDYRGATVAQTNELRRKLEKSGLKIQVVKNTLLRRAVTDTPASGIEPMLTGMTGVVFSGEDGIGAAKALKDALDPKGPIQVKGAFFDGEILGEDAVKTVAALPGREELLSMLLRTVQAGPRKVMGVIKAPGRDLVYLLKNYERKLAEPEGGE